MAPRGLRRRHPQIWISTDTDTTELTDCQGKEPEVAPHSDNDDEHTSQAGNNDDEYVNEGDVEYAKSSQENDGNWGRASQPVVWTAVVYDAENYDTRTNHQPVAQYHSHSPLQLNLGDRREDILLNGLNNVIVGSHTKNCLRPQWTGCVFEVACDGLAHFPRPRPTDLPHPIGPVHPTSLPYLPGRPYPGMAAPHPGIIGPPPPPGLGPMRPGMVPQPPAPPMLLPPAPRNIDRVEFKLVTRGSIIIRSPFLYRRLKAIAEYDPQFVGQNGAGLDDLGATMATNTDPDQPCVEIPAPWGFLLHRMSAMEEFLRNGDNDSLENTAHDDDINRKILRLEREHTEQLYNFLRPHYDNAVVPCQEQLEQSPPRISFEMLWYIFPPGTDVYVDSGHGYQVCVVGGQVSSLGIRSSWERRNNMTSKTMPCRLQLWYLDTNGEKIGRVPKNVEIDPFDGLQELTSLPVCPVSRWDKHDNGERRKRIIQRSTIIYKSLKLGHLLADYRGPCSGGSRHYTGKIVVDYRRGLITNSAKAPRLGLQSDSCYHFAEYDDIPVRDGDDLEDEILSEIKKEDQSSDSGDDSEDGYQSNPPGIERVTKMRVTPSRKRGTIGFDTVSDENNPKIKNTPELTEHQLLLLFPRIWAFALKTKQWLTIQADFMTEVAQSDEGLGNLVVGETERRTIKALATRQNSRREVWAADFIEGKGTGQIMLLHGPPGVGKTYTVEAIAEFLHRPLLALTVADIGTIETQVEMELLKWFSLAEVWNAVLLVDEADIFLERRQNRDLARNGLVSAFLRRMEYFKGLLFLTTNRVGQIDDAFISRVHVAIGYPALSPEDKVKIWQGFFRKLAKERAGKIQIAPNAKRWVLERAGSGEAQQNGRDIRNALQTAITLAEAECEEDPEFDPEKMIIVVDQSHFEKVLDISNKFQSYVRSIRREDERKRAAARFDRNDYFASSQGETKE
ncbi:hypothetical protein F5Y10DRAFT_233636 [Nemania abortiva]|nr:hypothetical protein F5Y10DRAFT_233636 [Nemania abortiva]